MENFPQNILKDLIQLGFNPNLRIQKLACALSNGLKSKLRKHNIHALKGVAINSAPYEAKYYSTFGPQTKIVVFESALPGLRDALQ